MALSAAEIIQIIQCAKEAGCASIEVEGVKASFTIASSETKLVQQEVPEMKAEDIVAPASPYDDLDEDMVKFWSTPHFDELVAQREAQTKKVEGE